MERETRVRAHVSELEARVSQQEDSHAVRLRSWPGCAFSQL